MSGARVLLVGTFGGGGVHQYVEEQHRRLPSAVDTATYDMHTGSEAGGVRWFVVGLVLAAVAAIRFPFQRRPDVVHVHTSHRFSFYRASFYVLFGAYVWGRPVVLHVHGSSFDEFLTEASGPLRWYQNLVLAASDRVVVLSSYWESILAERVPAERIVVLPNAVDPREYEPAAGATPPRLVFVSNLIERKGVTELLEAVDRLAAADAEFAVDVAGDGPLAPEVEAAAERHDELSYHGYVSEERKRELLSAGSIFVLPTAAENLPIAMLEGMAGGNAVVATRVGAIPDVIGPENGLLVEPGDVAALTAALEELIADPDRTASMGSRNSALVRERFTWDAATDRLCELYETLAGSAGSAA